MSFWPEVSPTCLLIWVFDRKYLQLDLSLKLIDLQQIPFSVWSSSIWFLWFETDRFSTDTFLCIIFFDLVPVWIFYLIWILRMIDFQQIPFSVLYSSIYLLEFGEADRFSTVLGCVYSSMWLLQKQNLKLINFQQISFSVLYYLICFLFEFLRMIDFQQISFSVLYSSIYLLVKLIDFQQRSLSVLYSSMWLL